MKKTQKNAREQQNSNKIRQEEEINAYNSCEIIKKIGFDVKTTT